MFFPSKANAAAVALAIENSGSTRSWLDVGLFSWASAQTWLEIGLVGESWLDDGLQYRGARAVGGPWSGPVFQSESETTGPVPTSGGGVGGSTRAGPETKEQASLESGPPNDRGGDVIMVVMAVELMGMERGETVAESKPSSVQGPPMALIDPTPPREPRRKGH